MTSGKVLIIGVGPVGMSRCLSSDLRMHEPHAHYSTRGWSLLPRSAYSFPGGACCLLRRIARGGW